MADHDRCRFPRTRLALAPAATTVVVAPPGATLFTVYGGNAGQGLDLAWQENGGPVGFAAGVRSFVRSSIPNTNGAALEIVNADGAAGTAAWVAWE